MNKKLIKKIDDYLDEGIVSVTVEKVPLNKPDEPSVPIGCVGMEYVNEFHLKLLETLEGTPIHDMILYHEYGHIYYRHNLYTLKTYKRIRDFIDQNSDYITESAEKLSISEKNLNKIFSSTYVLTLMNIAGDMQINSTILDRKDIDLVDQIAPTLYPNSSEVKFDSIHPSKYGFLPGRSFIFYINQILSNIEKFLILPEGMQGMAGGSGGDGEDEEGEGQSGGFFNKEMLEELENSDLFDENGDLKDNDEGEDEEDEGKGKGKDGDEESEDEEEGDGEDEDFGLNKGDSGGATNTKNTRNILQSLDDVFKDLKYNKENRYTHKRNIFKNQHRGRCKDVFIPTIRTEIRKVIVEKMIFLVDVSSSMSQDSIFGIVNEISKKVKGLGLKSVRMITWNTSKVQDFNLVDFESCKTSLYISGGTDLDGGIAYIRGFNKDKYPLILISDLGDNMQAWNREFDQCEFPKYVITTGSKNGWGGNIQSLMESLNKDIKIFESDYA